MLLTDWGPTADRWFRSGRGSTSGARWSGGQEYPDIKWLLIGDDGQHDPEIYSDFLRKHPDHCPPWHRQ